MADAPAVVTAGKAKWTRLATLALVLAALGPILFLAAGFIWGLDFSDDAGYFSTVAAIGLLGAFFMSRSNTWAKVAGVVGALLLCFGMWWTVFGLFVPGSFFDFVPGVLVLPMALTAVVSGIGSIRATKRGEVTAEPVAGEKKGLRFVLTVVIVTAVVSAGLTYFGQSTADEADADSVVAMKDFEFPEEEISVAGGSTVLVRNDDPFMHTFTVEELDIDVVLSPGSSELIEIPAEAGTYIVFCQPHTSDPEDPSEDDMAATLTIE